MKRIWVTRDGRRLKIKDMTTYHIKNCISLLDRYHLNKLYSICSLGNSFLGEVAEQVFDNAVEGILQDGWKDKAQEFIDSFNKELQRRDKEQI